MDDPLPAHIRPEDEIYFRKPLPLRPMTFRARWVLGFKVMIAAQLVWLPITFFFRLLDRMPLSIGLAGLAACIVLGPLWACALIRGSVANAMAQRLVSETLATGADKPPA